jgi:hypothetical protein
MLIPGAIGVLIFIGASYGGGGDGFVFCVFPLPTVVSLLIAFAFHDSLLSFDDYLQRFRSWLSWDSGLR